MVTYILDSSFLENSVFIIICEREIHILAFYRLTWSVLFLCQLCLAILRRKHCLGDNLNFLINLSNLSFIS